MASHFLRLHNTFCLKRTKKALNYTYRCVYNRYKDTSMQDAHRNSCDLNLTDITSHDLKLISDLLGSEYLKEATIPPSFPLTGLTWGAESRIFVNVVAEAHLPRQKEVVKEVHKPTKHKALHRGCVSVHHLPKYGGSLQVDETPEVFDKVNAPFLISTSTPFIFFSPELMETLGVPDKYDKFPVSVHGQKVLAHRTPEDSNFKNINILGMHFLSKYYMVGSFPDQTVTIYDTNPFDRLSVVREMKETEEQDNAIESSVVPNNNNNNNVNDNEFNHSQETVMRSRRRQWGKRSLSHAEDSEDSSEKTSPFFQSALIHRGRDQRRRR